MKSTPGWENCVNIWGPEGKQRGKQRPRELDYPTGLRLVRKYLDEGFHEHGHHLRNSRRWLCGRIRWPLVGGQDQRQEEGNHHPDVEQGVSPT